MPAIFENLLYGAISLWIWEKWSLETSLKICANEHLLLVKLFFTSFTFKSKWNNMRYTWITIFWTTKYVTAYTMWMYYQLKIQLNIAIQIYRSNDECKVNLQICFLFPPRQWNISPYMWERAPIIDKSGNVTCVR